MKKVLTTLSGGFPLTLDELEYIQSNVKEIASGLGEALSFGSTTVKLYGIEASIDFSGATPVLNVTPGLFWYSDEIYLFDEIISLPLDAGTTIEDIENDWEYDLELTTSNPVSFRDATINNINEVRKATLTNTPATWSGLTYGDCKSLKRNIIGDTTTVVVKGSGWNMDGLNTYYLPLPSYVNAANFVGISSITVLRDSSNTKYDLNRYNSSTGTVDGGIESITFGGAPEVILSRKVGGVFDNSYFSGSGERIIMAVTYNHTI